MGISSIPLRSIAEIPIKYTYHQYILPGGAIKFTLSEFFYLYNMIFKYMSSVFENVLKKFKYKHQITGARNKPDIRLIITDRNSPPPLTAQRRNAIKNGRR